MSFYAAIPFDKSMFDLSLVTIIIGTGTKTCTARLSGSRSLNGYAVDKTKLCFSSHLGNKLIYRRYHRLADHSIQIKLCRACTPALILYPVWLDAPSVGPLRGRVGRR